MVVLLALLLALGVTHGYIGKTNLPYNDQQVYCGGYWFQSITSASCIKIFTTGKSWQDARLTCQEEGGDLAKIRDKEMNFFVRSLVDTPPKNERYWIGLHRKPNSTKFVWLDEENVTKYTKWGKNEPSKDAEKNCVAIEQAYYEPWTTKKCSAKLNFACEKPLRDSKYSALFYVVEQPYP
ncbi:C-type mannose receptor 2 [Elysia marginata]|uniref:C-type mannose receptor 2 n=1 Tax=Elysia marginata TaxID=1093978 RepID=A0AAV4J3I0_9GAST|nr:C-type mannose receptor 2 [Elysia marginata]